MKTVTLISLLPALLLLACSCSISAAGIGNKKSSVYVDYEYGKLTEVIVGLENGKSPDISAPWFEDAMKILPEDEAEISRATAGLNWKKLIYPDSGKSESQLLAEENNALIAVLQKLGVKVYRPNEITEEYIIKNYGKDALINGYSQDFPRDNALIIGNNIIEFNLRTPIRRVDISGFKDIFREKAKDETVKWFSMPHTELLAPVSNDIPLLEGGDFMQLGETILVGNSLNPNVGSNEAGYRWIKSILGDKFNFIRVPLVEEILHLDCALSIPKRGLAIICPEAFVNGIPDCIKDWDLIKVPLKDAKRLAVNGLPVDEKNYIMSHNKAVSNSYLKAELEKRGITVHMVYFNTHNGEGGSIRCATLALKRAID
ncbi:MAG: arginine deiminase-related protein [Armatimonadota bacterium]